ncbi:Zn(2)-C6 fungal-type domain-containing protein [Favolaschia claudopus]|uniref:Zn(2)-C6 fungal-type domain-containing protein n=1 Tax=Favolaschia claudopus TaxID=2862362 RepID=A0AAW0D200_9AGAR
MPVAQPRRHIDSAKPTKPRRTTKPTPNMTSHSFQILSDKEVIDMKRSKGIMACAECQRRKLKCDKKFPCSSCVRRGRADICPTGDMGFIGRGRRIMRSESLALSTTIHSMGDRIKELEDAVAHASGDDKSESNHPLLRQQLLSIKSTTELPRSHSAPIPAQSGFQSGAMAVVDSDTTRYFGPTAGPAAMLSVQGSHGSDRSEYAPPFAQTIESFPLGNASPSSSSWDTNPCIETLLKQLPDELRAWALYNIFISEASWYGTPTMPDQLQELMLILYGVGSTPSTISPHGLAVVFLAFAAAALADTSLQAYSPEADRYFDLGRAALTLKSVFDSEDLNTIRALVMAGLYYATGGARYSIESSWTITSMAVALSQRLRLHRESDNARFDHHTAERRRALFWEVYSMETYRSLSFGRPLAIPLADVTCEWPEDVEQTTDSRGNIIPGFFRTKWSFTKDATAPIAEVYSSARSPSYEEVLNLDQRLRRFMERAPFPHYAEKARKTGTLLWYVRAQVIPRFAANMMVYIHRGSFLQALKDNPLNPLEGPYAASFLAAYRGASMIIKSDTRSFALFPQTFHRWWPIWKSLVNASFIVGSIVAKTPTAAMANTAYYELLSAVQILEQGATHSFLAAGSLPVLQRLKNKASLVYASFNPHPLDTDTCCPLNSSSCGELASDKDFAMLAGADPLLHPLPPPSIPHMPSLIPDIMPPPPPPPSTSNSTPDSWLSDLPADPHPHQNAYAWSNFPFEPICKDNFCFLGPSHEELKPSADLDEYLTAQMDMEGMHMAAYPPAYCRDSGPRSDVEWASFLSVLDMEG